MVGRGLGDRFPKLLTPMLLKLLNMSIRVVFSKNDCITHC